MARKKADTEATNLSDTGTSSVKNRRAAEKARQAEARRVRAEVVEETVQAQKQTAAFLKSKPTDSRTITDTRNVGG